MSYLFTDNFFFFLFFPMWVILNWVGWFICFLRSSLVLSCCYVCVFFHNLGSCVICAPLSGVLGSTISLYVIQHVGPVLVNTRSPYCLTCRSKCWLTLDRYVWLVYHPTLDCMSTNMLTDMSAETWPVYWSTLGRYGECQLSVEYWLTVGGILIDYLVAYRSTVV